jgi:hypothetical protein
MSVAQWPIGTLLRAEPRRGEDLNGYIGDTFRIGQRVICVEFPPILEGDLCVCEGSSSPDLRVTLPKRGAFYTVRSTLIAELPYQGNVLWPLRNKGDARYPIRQQFIRLREFVNHENPEGESEECMFASFWFRGLIERETDISLFTRILVDCKERVVRSVEADKEVPCLAKFA